MKVNRIMAAASSAALLGALAACGGGSTGTGAPAQSNNPPPSGGLTAANSVSGKAIDGYLVGATVCIDENANGACDTGEPTTVTDSNGNYTLPADSTATGKKLLVTVGPSTRDLSRPNFTFPASFTLSQIAQFGTTQNISPLTTMIVAQMETGLSQAQATAAVQTLIGSTIDPNADYVAGGDTATSSLATQIIDKMTSFATNGALDTTTVRNVLNAIVAKGDVASVTQADVTAQASVPVYQTGIDASQVLANPTYGFDAFEVTFFGGGGVNDAAIVQDVRQITSGALQLSEQEMPNGATVFQDIPITKYDGMAGEYEMKPDGTWTGLVTQAQLHAPLSLTSIGTTLGGTDPNTGIGFTIEYRQTDLGGQPLASAVPMHFGFGEIWTAPQLTGANFPTGTNAYVSLLSHSTEQVILPAFFTPCDSSLPTPPTNCSSGVTEDGVNHPVEGINGFTYTSVQQAIGLQLTVGIELLPNGQVQIGNDTQSATWSTYERNPNVLVINLPDADIATLAGPSGTPLTAPLLAGAKLVLALHNGNLQLGWLYPASYAEKSVQFTSGLPAQLVDAVHAYVASQQLPTP